MEVNIKSAVLYSYLAPLLGQHQQLARQSIDGFVLLKNVKLLQAQLNDLKERTHIDLPQGLLMSLVSEQDAQIEAELTLLLEGLITDHQVFRSFGYENLLERGYLSYDLWKAFQSANASLIIDRLDNAFHAMSGDEDDVHIDQGARDDFQNDVLDPHTLSMQSPLNLSQAARSGDVVRVKDLLADGCDPDALDPRFTTLPLVEAIKHNHQEIIDLLISHGAKVDGPNNDIFLSPLITALKGENTFAISKLLSHMADLKILGQLRDADYLRFAISLIMNHGVSTESVLRAVPRSKVTAKRLRCALFDAGADVKYTTGNSRLSYEIRFLSCAATLDGYVTGNHKNQTEALQSIDNERSMIRAIQMKDMESVDLHIKLGADPTLGLTAALLIRDPRIFKLLLERGADTNCIVSSKERASLMAAIEAGDRNFVDLLLETRRAVYRLDTLNFIHNDWTPLMIAVQHNNEYIARRLIRDGASSTFTTYNGDSLTIARQNGFHDMLQILLGGIPISHPLPDSRKCLHEIVPQSLQSINRKEELEWDAQWIDDVQPNTEEQQDSLLRRRDSLMRRLNKIRLRNMRLQFRKQHTKILACAEASVNASRAFESRIFAWTEFETTWRKPYSSIFHNTPGLFDDYIERGVSDLHAGPSTNSRAWGRGFDADYSTAWSSGINVMRNLHAGKLPSSLNDTIMFLAIAKAMCLSGSAPALSTWYSDFASDIGRWQILFKSDIDSLLDFREAVSSIWGIRLEHLTHVNSPDSETLASFQELAVSLADDAELSFGLRGLDDGLIASQDHWRSCNELRVPEENRHDLVQQESRDFLNRIQALRQSEENATWRPPGNHTTQDSGTSMPIWNMFRTDPKVHTFNLTATLLMAGFIFGVVLTFLLGKKYH